MVVLKAEKHNQKKLLYVLDESMRNIFGETTAKAVYYHLQQGYLLKFEDIPEKPQVFARAIREIFGEAGADVIETLLVRDLCEKFGVKGQGRRADSLADCMHEIKLQVSKTNEEKECPPR